MLYRLHAPLQLVVMLDLAPQTAHKPKICLATSERLLKKVGTAHDWTVSCSNTRKDVQGQLQLRVKSAGIMSHEVVSHRDSALIEIPSSEVFGFTQHLQSFW